MIYRISYSIFCHIAKLPPNKVHSLEWEKLYSKHVSNLKRALNFETPACKQIIEVEVESILFPDKS